MILIKDKKDMVLAPEGMFTDSVIVGAMEKVKVDPATVEILSTKFSRIGKGTLDKYPNLKWIVCRAHGYDTVDIEEVKKRGIGLVCTKPHAGPCSDYIHNHLHKINEDRREVKRVVFDGFGSIAQQVTWHGDHKTNFIDKTRSGEVQFLKWADCVVLTVPLTDRTRGMVNADYFRKMGKGKYLISISRSEVIDNVALLDAIKEGNIKKAIIDTLAPDLRTELLDTGSVKWTQHQAWCYNLEQHNGNYFPSLRQILNKCKKDDKDIPGLVVARKKQNTLCNF